MGAKIVVLLTLFFTVVVIYTVQQQEITQTKERLYINGNQILF